MLFVKVLIVSPYQQFKLNIMMIAISTLKDFATNITVYIFLYTDFYKLPYTQI